MSSNEHPDMSGNWADEPLRCHTCDKPVHEEKAFGAIGNEDLIFCSAECVESWEDNQTDQFFDTLTGD